MSRWLVVTVLVVGSFVAAAAVPGGDQRSFTGSQYRGWPELAQLVYVAGFFEGFFMGDGIRERPPGAKLHPLVPCLAPLPNGELHVIVGRFLNAYPGRRHEPMAILMMTAAFDACR